MIFDGLLTSLNFLRIWIIITIFGNGEMIMVIGIITIGIGVVILFAEFYYALKEVRTNDTL